MDGYVNQNSRNFLPQYFAREQKKAEKEFYSSTEFYTGCRNIVNQLITNLETQLFREKNECYRAISGIKNGSISFIDPNSSLTHEEQKENSIKEWQNQLNNWTIKNFTVNLFNLSSKYTGYLTHDDLVAINSALDQAENLHIETNRENNYDNTFIESILKGIKELQNQDTNADCIRIIKEDKKQLEAPFRNWFKTYFSGIYETVNAEPEKGNGRIDLKIEDANLGTKIIEFKGWWNSDKKLIVNQIISYLTDFESVGYIVLINDKKKKINSDYLSIITSESAKYVPNSLDSIKTKRSDFEYFASIHTDNIRLKKIYHFIINVY